ncbi:Dr1-like protein [Micractinium conductrix]|uniref:Dr1-like protein n=1 Tax=Micractinium conductrix TaxID=554055 RepID=A0A2P6VC71_9CHLO|nr:Dr1-like protein [Micractinium conductrix]|eukprot:PSC71651.1 Dr1-like protein [Micractinium conductrix]
MDDLGLPRSGLQKAAKALVPGDMRIAGDAQELLVHACNAFVHVLSTQANAISEREKRSTISPEHVVNALEELEFGEQYVAAVRAAWDEWKVDNKEHQQQKLEHKKSGRAKGSGLTQQQLIELQHKLFEEARAATLSGPPPSLTLDVAHPAVQQQQPEAQQQAEEQQPEEEEEEQQQQQQVEQAGDGSAAAAAVPTLAAAAAPVPAAAPAAAVQEAAPAAAAGEDEDGSGESLDDVSDVDSELVG